MMAPLLLVCLLVMMAAAVDLWIRVIASVCVSKMSKHDKRKIVFNIFCFATDTFMESINSSGLSVTHIDQGVTRGQIN